MPISSIGPGAGLFPQAEPRGRETRATEQRVAVAEVAAPLPGGGERDDSQGRLLSRMVEDISGSSLTYDRRLQFEIDHDSNEVIVKVIDNATDEVVRVLPPEELQRLHRPPREAMGSLLSERM